MNYQWAKKIIITIITTNASCADVASGSSEDWVKSVAGVPYPYTLELRDNGTYGFLLPAEFIDRSGRETYNALNTLCGAVLRRHQVLDAAGH